MNKKIKISTKGWQALLNDIKRCSSISLAELSLLVKKHTSAGTDYVIWMLQQKNILKLVQGRRKGLYVIIDDKAANVFIKDPIEAIQALYGKDVIFCYGTALYIHGLSRYGMMSDYFIHSDTSRTQRPIGQAVVRFVKTRLGSSIGVTKRNYGDRLLFTTDLERTIVDCIHRPAYAQGWENVIHALNRIERVNVQRIIEYVKKYGTPSLVAKVGVVLEHFARQWKVPADSLSTLSVYLPRDAVKFGRGLKGALNKKWNIYVPGDLFYE